MRRHKKLREPESIIKMFEGYNRKREDIVNNIINDPHSLQDRIWGYHLSIDDRCGNRMGENPHAPNMCENCRSLSRLADDLTDKKIRLEYGTMDGQEVIIERTKANKYMFIDKSMNDNSRAMIADNPELITCGTKSLDGVSLIHSDGETNKILTTICHNSFDSRSIKMYNAFECANTTYTIEEDHINFLDLRYISSEVIRSMILQIVSTLYTLKRYDFCHGDPSMKYVVVGEGPITSIENDIYLKGQHKISLKLGDRSSLTIGRSRLACNDQIFNNPYDKESLKVWNAHPLTIYCVDGNRCRGFLDDRRSGIILYPGSFDFYCILLDLMSHPSTSEETWKTFYPIMSKMFIGHGDLERLTNRIADLERDSDEEYCCEDICELLLDGIWLRCDILNVVQEYFSGNSDELSEDSSDIYIDSEGY